MTVQKCILVMHRKMLKTEAMKDGCVIENHTKIRMIDDHDHLHYNVDRRNPDSSTASGQFFGSNLVSVDKVHTNDEGYELWGRHIAAVIVKHRQIF